MADSTTLGHSLRQLLLFSLVALHVCFSFFHSPQDLNIVFFLRSIEMPRRVAWKLLSCFYSLFLSLSIRSLFPTRRLVLLFLFYISSARYFARRRSSWLTHFALEKKKNTKHTTAATLDGVAAAVGVDWAVRAFHLHLSRVALLPSSSFSSEH